MSTPRELQAVQDAVWRGSIPLEIRLAPADCRTYDKSDPYMIQCPRLSYLPFLLPRLHAFFTAAAISPPDTATAWFSFEGVPLKWHYPVGLLYDLFSGASPAHAPSRLSVSGRDRSPSLARSPPRSAGLDAPVSAPLPWPLILHFSEFPDHLLVRLDTAERVIHDAFINSVKEADFLRNGSANAIMKLSKDDSTRLWEAVRECDQLAFIGIHNRLLPAPSQLRNVPLRVYLPASSPSLTSPHPTSPRPMSPPGSPRPEVAKPSTAAPTHLRVVQPLVPATQQQTRTPQTVGTALHAALPSLFPSRKTPIQAFPVLHGAVLPMTAPLEEVLRGAAYMDGWLHIGVEMHG